MLQNTGRLSENIGRIQLFRSRVIFSDSLLAVSEAMGTVAIEGKIELLQGALSSPIGEMLIVLDVRERMHVLEWRDHEERLHKHLRRHYGETGSNYVLRQQALPAGISHLLNAYFAGEITALDAIPVHARGTEFQKEVWPHCVIFPVVELPAMVRWQQSSSARMLCERSALPMDRILWAWLYRVIGLLVPMGH